MRWGHFQNSRIAGHESRAEDAARAAELLFSVVCQRTLAVAPGNFFDDDRFAAAAIDTTHGVKQKNQESPERDELEPPLGELIVTGCRLVTPRADRRRTFTRTDSDLNALVIGTEAGLLVNKPRKTVATV